jgi:hypothetical protein
MFGRYGEGNCVRGFGKESEVGSIANGTVPSKGDGLVFHCFFHASD